MNQLRSIFLLLVCLISGSVQGCDETFVESLLQELDQAGEAPTGEIYHMITATIEGNEVCFTSDEEFEKALRVGFFRVQTPDKINLEAARAFALSFTSDPRYLNFGVLNVVNGFLQGNINQAVRFSLERDHWDKCYVDLQEVEGPPNYTPEIQSIGHELGAIGVKILRSILRKVDLPEELWFEATAGAADGEGSLGLLFNNYDPKYSTKSYGVAQHADFSFVTVLDTTQAGLQAFIDCEWRPLHIEDGYLTINFGYPLEKLLPGVKASVHRVITQTDGVRTSMAVFVDPRVGCYRKKALEKRGGSVGMVYDWDSKKGKLVHPQTTSSFFERLSQELHGTLKKQGAEKE